jgi:hypothetical protein
MPRQAPKRALGGPARNKEDTEMRKNRNTTFDWVDEYSRFILTDGRTIVAQIKHASGDRERGHHGWVAYLGRPGATEFLGWYAQLTEAQQRARETARRRGMMGQRKDGQDGQDDRA